MKQFIRSALVLAGAAALAAARTPAAPNPWTVVVTGGPYAGTYQAKANEVICFYAKERNTYAATFRDFKANTPRSLAEGGIMVDNPNVAGAKKGDLHVAFGTDDKRSISYDVYAVPVTMTRKGTGAALAGTARTKEGVLLHITASCAAADTV
jgi:hypothetical protein